MELLRACFYAFASAVAFGIVFNQRGKTLIIAGVGGALGWLIYAGLATTFDSEIPRYFLAGIGIAFYSESAARIFKAPAIVYLAAALIPLVPGGGIYYTMEYCVAGDVDASLATGLHTLGIAGALAMGVIIVSSFFRIWVGLRRERRIKSKRAAGIQKEKNPWE
ncbi:MAG: threonine/serine exporter family protein [Eubacterium sp.]|nr:threonine/serine exporter family protein [Eubacterium sp.]